MKQQNISDTRDQMNNIDRTYTAKHSPETHQSTCNSETQSKTKSLTRRNDLNTKSS